MNSNINTSERLFDLVRYMRSELHEAGLITEDEYSWLVSEAPMAQGKGSPSPRRLESYDECKAREQFLKGELAKIIHLVGGESEDPDRDIARMQDIATDALKSVSRLTCGSTGALAITAERIRQIHKEGWDDDIDDAYTDGSLIQSALCYLGHALGTVCGMEQQEGVPRKWPWDVQWWKPSVKPERDLVKAGALVAAEIDRLRRVRPEQSEAPNEQES